MYQTNQIVVFETTKAINTCVEKADMKLMGGYRVEFFREFLCQIVFELLKCVCEQSHQFCCPELVALLRKLFDFIGSGKVRYKLFDGNGGRSIITGPRISLRYCRTMIIDGPADHLLDESTHNVLISVVSLL
jgi:hypothetical protein